MLSYLHSKRMYLVNRNFINQLKIRTTSIYLLAVGFFSILGQVVILRELNVAFYGIELIYILSFAFWLSGTAIGAALGFKSSIPLDKNIQGLFLISAILLIADMIFIRGIRNLFGGVQGGYLPFLKQIIGLIIALLPIGLLSGLLFQWSAKKIVSENGTLAKAYAIESAGGVLGGLCSTLFLNFGINNFSIALICSVCFAFIVNYYSFSAKNRLMKYISTIATLVFVILFGLSHQIDLMMTSWNHPSMIESVDTPYNRVTITSSENQICVFEDDALSYETQGIAAEEFVQLSTLQATEFNNILVLGGGFEGIISELLKLPIKIIDYVEVNKDMIELLQKYLPEELRNSLKNKNVNIIYSDPRKFLKREYSYDIILVGMPEPMSAQTNRFYTKEFFKQCSNSLKKMGILAFKIPSSENIWTQQLTERNAGIYNAVKSSFKNVLVLPGVTNIFVASKSKLTTDTKLLINRFIERNLETRLVNPQYINYIFTNDRFTEVQKLISSRINNINSDLQPVCYSYTISIWLSKFFPDFAYSKNLLTTISEMRNSMLLYIIVILIFGMIIIIRQFVGVRRFTLVFITGFIGMILEIILILLYQNKNGILFRDIGLLLMAFMAGLSLGSFFVDKLFMIMKNQIRSEVWLGRLLLTGFFFLVFIVYLSIKHDLMSNLSIISIALLVNGIFVSGIFAFASLYQITNQQIVVRKLYTADLIGGCLGSLLASLILIPIYGFFFSLILTTILSVYCLIFIF
jgi:spermidine synthase